MHSINIHEAKTHFSRLLEQVQQGEEIIIAKAGHPIAKLSPYVPVKRKIAPPGSMEGQGFWIADDFDEPLEDVEDVFDYMKDGPRE
jgi:prevent-host-death family protein